MKRFFEKQEEKTKVEICKWKSENKEYLEELQRFLDKAENIKDDELKHSIIGQMLRCDQVLTCLSERLFKEYYQKGYEKAKKV